MSSTTLPQSRWNTFLQAFARRHQGSLVQMNTYDLKTEESVTSRSLPLQAIELDLEDERNPRINITVQCDNKEIKYVLFRPHQLIVHLADDGAEIGLGIESINTSTSVMGAPDEPCA